MTTAFEPTQPPVRTRPIVAAAQWQQVMDRSGYRCMCRGCGTTHRGSCIPCGASHDHYAPTGRRSGDRIRLLAAPDPAAYPTPAEAAAAPPAELRAWCERCYASAVRTARKAAAAARAEAAAADCLFSVDDL